MMEKTETQKVVSLGGLNSNVNHIQLSDLEPGSAVDLLNFEASLYGGYRRLSGFQPLNPDAEFVDPDGAEGRILCSAIYEDTIIVARKQQSGDTYDFYYNDNTADWQKFTTGLTRSSNGVTKIRWRVFNFDGTEKIGFVDGVNKACIYNGTTWYEIGSGETGADIANAGGNQAINNPDKIEIFRNHLFLAKDHLVVHSAPLKDYDFTVASGAGQIPAGFLTNGLKTFRDSLFVFGVKNIKKITVSDTTFVLQEVTSDIGCLATDSIVEVGGNLVFLSQDGFRPVSGTDRIGDTEIETVSKRIQQLITEEIVINDMSEVTSVIVRNKSQVRFFFSDPSKGANNTYGIIGCLRGGPEGSVNWEWGRLLGISASATCSGYIGANEYVIHGTHDGGVYRQEQGNSFNGAVVPAVYKTPFLDFGDVAIRKTIRNLRVFTRPEGLMEVTVRLVFDWEDPTRNNPNPYSIRSENAEGTALYGSSTYGTAVYSGVKAPILVQNVEGSGNSVQLVFTTTDTNPSYTIQGFVYQFSIDGRK